MTGPFQESDGAISMRRILALFFALASVPLGVIAIPSGAWFNFIPCAVCVVACLLLLFFTTWADVASIIKSVKGKE